jgi:hypothetical protein
MIKWKTVRGWILKGKTPCTYRKIHILKQIAPLQLQKYSIKDSDGDIHMYSKHRNTFMLQLA